VSINHDDNLAEVFVIERGTNRWLNLGENNFAPFILLELTTNR
jgi:hypothetical protein